VILIIIVHRSVPRYPNISFQFPFIPRFYWLSAGAGSCGQGFDQLGVEQDHFGQRVNCDVLVDPVNAAH